MVNIARHADKRPTRKQQVVASCKFRCALFRYIWTATATCDLILLLLLLVREWYPDRRRTQIAKHCIASPAWAACNVPLKASSGSTGGRMGKHGRQSSVGGGNTLHTKVGNSENVCEAGNTRQVKLDEPQQANLTKRFLSVNFH